MSAKPFVRRKCSPVSYKPTSHVQNKKPAVDLEFDVEALLKRWAPAKPATKLEHILDCHSNKIKTQTLQDSKIFGVKNKKYN